MRTIIAALALLTYLPAAAQTDYLPLEIGNEWSYYTLIDPPGEPYDTIKTGTFSVRDSVRIDERMYTLYDHPNALADTIRADGSGRILAWIDGEDHLYFDFTAPDSTTYSFPAFDEYEYTVTVRRNQSRETHAGTFEEVIAFNFDIPDVMDAGASFHFAPEVGLVYTSDGMGQPEWLYEARIGGRAIPSAIVPPERFGFSARVYPNPSTGAVNLRFVLEEASHTEITIFDALGRRQASLAGHTLPAGPHEVAWSAGRPASGIYFVAFESGGRRVVRPFTIAK